MNIPEYILSDIEKIRKILGDAIVHCGVFGSILRIGHSSARDVDVLFVYSGTTFENICQQLEGKQLSLPHILTYRNYGGKFPPPPLTGKYYDLVFIPKDKPDRNFMREIDGTVEYLTTPFESWRKSPKAVEICA